MDSLRIMWMSLIILLKIESRGVNRKDKGLVNIICRMPTASLPKVNMEFERNIN
jgi:hypothetical protein